MEIIFNILKLIVLIGVIKGVLFPLVKYFMKEILGRNGNSKKKLFVKNDSSHFYCEMHTRVYLGNKVY